MSAKWWVLGCRPEARLVLLEDREEYVVVDRGVELRDPMYPDHIARSPLAAWTSAKYATSRESHSMENLAASRAGGPRRLIRESRA